MSWFSNIFGTPAASTDGGEESWVEVDSAPVKMSTAWAPRGVCDRVKRWARTAAVPMAMLAACDVAEMPEADEVVQVYDARTGDWFDGVGGDLEDGDTFIEDGRVLRVAEDGVEIRGDAAVADLAEADATWVAEAAHRLPSGEDWVLVLGASDDAGHWLLSEVEAGERFAFQGRVFDSADLDADGDLEVRATGDVVSRVEKTHVRHSNMLIDLVVSKADGTTETIVGTPEHPFWLAAADDFVPMGELVVGDVLRTVGGGRAVVAQMVWSEGDFEVFNFEVEGVQNYFVRGPGSDAAGVLVHNGCGTATFHRYDGDVGPTGRHVTVEIKDAAGKSLGEFHQTGLKNSSLERVEPGDISGKRTQSTTPKPLDDADAAADFGGSGFPTGKNKRGNDCVNGACAVGNAGNPSGGEIKPQAVRSELGM